MYLGENIRKLGFGLMRLPQKDGAIDLEQVKVMVDKVLAAGFTYFDTAWAYPGSEDAIRQALVERYPREKFQLATKKGFIYGNDHAADLFPAKKDTIGLAVVDGLLDGVA